MELRTYYMYLLRKGPAWTDEKTPELDELQARHGAHIRSLMTSDAAVAGGPVIDGGDIVGLTIFRTATLEEARALAEADPGVRAGRFVVEIHPWMTLAGRLPEPATE